MRAPWYARKIVARLAVIGGLVCILWACCGCGKGGGVTGPSEPVTPSPETQSSVVMNTRPYLPMDVGTVWHFVREGAEEKQTDIAVVEDESGCKALHFVKNDVGTYHAIGQHTNNLWHVQERGDGFYANNCRGGFGKDAYNDEARYDMTTGMQVLKSWYIGERPYFLMPYAVADGQRFHGIQTVHVEYANGTKGDSTGSWDVTYRVAGDRLTLQFDEGSWNIAEDWTLQRGEGLVMIEGWTSQARTQLRYRLVRKG